MALKNFSFRKNWVGSEVVGMKITFFAIFDPTGAHILAPERPKYGILRFGKYVIIEKGTHALATAVKTNITI